MLRFAWVAMAAAACGRIGYAPLGADIDDGGSEPVDAPVDATLLDVGEVPVTDAGQDAGNPSIIWNGAGFGLAWHDTRNPSLDIYFARLDATGSRIGGDVRVSNSSGSSRDVDIIWTGAGYGLVWREDPGTGNRDVYFARLDVNGTLLAAPVQLTNNVVGVSKPSIARTATRYAIVWSDERSATPEVQFTSFDDAGLQLVTPIQAVNAAGKSDDPSIINSPSAGLVMSWSDARNGNDEIYSVRLDQGGSQISPEIRMTTTTSDSNLPEVVHGGSALGFGYLDRRTGVDEIFFSEHVAGGAITIDGLQLTTGGAALNEPAVAGGNDAYVLVWEEDLHVRYAHVVAGIVQSSGQVDASTLDAKSPDVVWTGQQFVVVWEDQRNVADDVLYLRALPL